MCVLPRNGNNGGGRLRTDAQRKEDAARNALNRAAENFGAPIPQPPPSTPAVSPDLIPALPDTLLTIAPAESFADVQADLSQSLLIPLVDAPTPNF